MREGTGNEESSVGDGFDEYDLAPPTSPAAKPVVAVPLPVTAVPTAAREPGAPPALAYQAPPDAGAVDPETIKNFWMPVWLLGGGVVVETAAAFLTARNVHVALTTIAVGLVASMLSMLVGLLIAARVRQIDLGNFWTAVFKLSAVAVAPGAAATLVSPILNHIPFGFVLSLGTQFVLYFALLGALFDLDQSDTWYCICVIFLVRLCVYFGLLALIAAR